MAQPIPGHVPLLATLRGSTIECVHYGSVAVCDRRGTLIRGAGDPEALNFARSTLKPLQALPLLQDHGLERFGFSSQELALMCASHNGESVHVGVVRRMLARIDAGEADLQCGAHPPMYYAATGAAAPPGVRFGALFHNCSGKHAGFLAFCRLHGQELGSYLTPDCALQARVRQAVQEAAGQEHLEMGIDGCNAPNYAVPLSRLAAAYARLAAAPAVPWAALRFAMLRHPDLVSGAGRHDLALAQAGHGAWIAKAGADGVQALAICDRGLGIVVRVADGNPRALHVITTEVLFQLGLLGESARQALAVSFRPDLRNTRGTRVGSMQPLFELDTL